ncbi:MAG: hypothetical protein KAI94_00390 [Anaerolineales bacterium]|nr:hypothetical protein [Anaerolineales bacterium]
MTDRRDEFEQIFERCLEQIQSGQKSLDSALAQYPGMTDELRPRLEAALWLDGRKSSLDPRPGFVAASSNRLISQIQQEMAAQVALDAVPEMGWFARMWASLFTRKRYAFQLALVVLLLACVVLGGAGVAYTAQGALPGDKTYSVKIMLEQAELATTTDPAERARLHAEFAQTRLNEAQDLVMEGRYAYVPDTVGRYEYHVNQAVRSLHQLAREDSVKAKVLAESLSGILTVQTASLTVMIVAVPSQYKPDIEWALSISDSSLLLVEKVLVRVGGTPRSIPTDSYKPTSTKKPTSTPRPSATATPTQSVKPTNTAVLIKTATKTLTPTLRPWSTSTYTPTPQNTRNPTSDPATAKPTATNTQRPPTDTPRPPTNTPVPPSNTPVPPTNTQPPPPTNTPEPPPTEPPPTDPPPTDPPYP